MVSALFYSGILKLLEMVVCYGNNCSLNPIDLPAESGHLRVRKRRDRVNGTFESYVMDGLQSK
ncbi:hypothetical protein COI41_21780 [Bacillus toyonensis]|nr:hypothetical protein CN567_28345 [Bacillus toyonensis]PFX73202.1 hypothetical protein COL37_28485 [Bacillus toyonensis]PFX83722.1 hypothetical protein COL38_05245 [Bacillus toyonensis]PGA96619.1 hypothetical protein COL98_31610 [Bacillus toyonensis]PHF52355.1 hypothetical protein COI41_21780 [Bacillus toyonensis]